MQRELIEVTVSGPKAAAAADAIALGLMTAGAQVRCPGRRAVMPSSTSSVLDVGVVVRVVSATLQESKTATGTATISSTSATKAVVGGILLLALLGAEVRLHFGVRWDTFVTLAGVWVFWRVCLRAD